MKKIYIASLVVALAIFGSYFFPRQIHESVITGAVGDVNTSPRMVQVSMDLTTTTPNFFAGTSTMYNGDGRDRIITSVEFYAANIGSSTSNGTGLVVWSLKLGTSTNMYTPNTNNFVYNSTVATATPILFVSTSSPGTVGTANSDFARIWTAGTYLPALLNGTSTGNTGTGETGFLTVHYRTAP